MKDDKKHIDRLFQEGLKNFEATPSHAVWENVSKQLLNNKRQRKVIPLWIKMSSIAAGLLLLITLGNNIFFQNNNTTPNVNETVVGTESTNKQSSDSSLDSNVIDSNNTTNTEYLAQEDSNESEANDSSKDGQKNTILNKNEAVLAKNDRNTTSNKDNLNLVTKKKLANEMTKEATTSTVASSSNSKNPNVVESQKNPAKQDLSKATDISSTIAKTENANKIDDKEINKVGEISIEEAIAKNNIKETENEFTKDKMSKRWSVAPNVAPVYFNSLGTGSSIDTEFVDNTKSGEVNMSYGVSASYAINNKINLRIGVNNVKLGFKTHDAFDASGLEMNPIKSVAINNIEIDKASPELAYVTVSEMRFAQVPEPLYNQYNASINQKLGFIEVPLEMEYKLSDKKLGLSVLGGFSALFLNENEVYSTLNDETSLIGEATNINKMSFSANLGVGLNFKLTEKFKLNLEPTFKYQLNTFKNTSGDFKPYFIGIYSGFSFEF